MLDIFNYSLLTFKNEWRQELNECLIVLFIAEFKKYI